MRRRQASSSMKRRRWSVFTRRPTPGTGNAVDGSADTRQRVVAAVGWPKSVVSVPGATDAGQCRPIHSFRVFLIEEGDHPGMESGRRNDDGDDGTDFRF